ncbi:MAG: D-arabinono-1,4-lactone oxidase, partial [Campylobacterota bacterium]|nr:D-arabinono-1,4-lactone oxidase [Campylobacterota bacterium]
FRTIKQNWAKTHTCKTNNIIYAKSEDEIVHIVKYANEQNQKLKVVGGGDSYNDIFCPGENGILLSLELYSDIIFIDKQNNAVTFEAGMMMPDLIKKLKKHNLAVSNLGTNIFDCVAGSCSTGYHGSGINYKIFSSFVKSFEVITPIGEKKIVNNEDDEFDIYAVGLGVLGIISKITLQCEPSFNLEVIEKKMSFEDIEKNFDELLCSNDHFKFIWIPHTDDFMVWLGNRTEKKESSKFKKFMTYFTYGVVINNFFHEFLLYIASFKRALIPKINKLMSKILIPKENRSVWQSHWGFFLPHLLKQDVVEYAFDIKDTFTVFKEVISNIKDKNIYVDTPIEVRFVQKDSYWMSPTGDTNSCWIGTKIHFPYGKKPEYLEYFTMIDEVLLKYNGRPHWGKQFRIKTEDFKKSYPKWDDFWDFADIEDPNKILQNDFVKRLRG